MAHPQRTCVLLEVKALNELINYFQMLHQNPIVLFELKGVHITEIQCDTTTDTTNQAVVQQTVTCELNHSANADITTSSDTFPFHLFFYYKIMWLLEFTNSRCNC